MSDIQRRYRDDPRFTMKLVKQIKSHPCLYNNMLPGSKNVTEEAWIKVAQEVNETVNHCKTKWKNLRSVFVRGLKPTPGDPRKIKRPYYLSSSMRFLLPYLKKPPNPDTKLPESLPSPPQPEFVEQSDDCEEDYTDIEEYSIEDVQNEQSLYKLNELKQEKVDDEENIHEETIIINPPNIPVQRRNSKISEVDNLIIEPQRNEDLRKMFLMSLLPEVCELTEKQMRKFKRKVLELIDDISAEC